MNPNAKAFVFNPSASSFTPNSLPFPTNPSASGPAAAVPVVEKEGEGEENGERAEKEEGEGKRDETKLMRQLHPGYSGGLPPPHQYPPQYYQV